MEETDDEPGSIPGRNEIDAAYTSDVAAALEAVAAEYIAQNGWPSRDRAAAWLAEALAGSGMEAARQAIEDGDRRVAAECEACAKLVERMGDGCKASELAAAIRART